MKRVAPAKFGNDELLAHAGAMIAHGRYKDARRLLRILNDRRLTNRQREERSIVKARYYYRTGEYRRAAALAKPRFQLLAHRRESMLILARSYRRMDKKREAADIYRYFARAYPNDAKAAEALYVAARLYQSDGKQRSAQRALANLRKSYPSSYHGKLAAYLSAREFAREGDYERSVLILERVVKSSRRTDAGALYYLADTYGKLGRKSDKELLLKELRGLSPHSFYVDPVVEASFRRPVTTSRGEVALYGEFGLLRFLSKVAKQKDAARMAVRDAISESGTNPHGDVEVQRCLERGKRFLDSGFRQWGERELEYASRRCFNSPAALLDLGQVYDEYGLPWHSIRLYQRVKDSIHWKKRAAYSRSFSYLMYPVPYPVQVLEHAARYGLPPHLVYAMIREESRFDRDAVSRAGAVGLMQLMPETGRYVAGELEMPDWGDENLLDPEINLAFGIWYASSLIDVSGGDYLRMLAAYNAGPANAKRWFAGSDRAANVIDVVDGIDFKETRSYVQRIVESANVYHRLYFDDESITAGPGR
jgi:soluble lytic murein transglycosylase